jgi:UDP-N-acetylenolpyruvoylglucosamine reductase
MKSVADHLETLRGRLSNASVLKGAEPLAKHTTLRVGGPADLYVEPASENDLAETLRFCKEHAIPAFVLGRGSNLLVSDAGYRGVILCLNQPAFCQITFQGSGATCGAGAKLKQVAVEARRQSVTGFEFLEGIPGSVGGALRMNAGAMGCATFELVKAVRVMDLSGEVREWLPAEMQVNYRHCAVLDNRIALSVCFLGQPGVQEEIARRMSEYSRKRWSSQPAAPSAGCMFKNPSSIPAGRLIDELGLKGTRVGGARVSMEHGNFLVNDGNATASDILGLIALVRERARQERGIELETEVQFLGA